MPNKTEVLREDEMHLPWLVLLLFPVFRCRIISPDLKMFRFYNWDSSRRRRDFQSGLTLLPFPDFPIPSLSCDRVFMFLRHYTFAVSTFPPALPCAPAGINHRHNNCACVLHIAFGLRARPYIFPSRVLWANAEYRITSPSPILRSNTIV